MSEPEPPTIDIDPQAFWSDPYPQLATLRAEAPVARIPQLSATLLTRRDDVFREEKRIDILSSVQPNGLLQKVMGSNLMRKDGDAHQVERRALFPALSPRTVRDHLTEQFREIVAARLDILAAQDGADLVPDFAMPVAADALRVMTGLTNMKTGDIDRTSQAMLDAAANYRRDAEVDRLGHAAAAEVGAAITDRLPALRAAPDLSIISVFDQAGLTEAQIAGNVRVIIGGGQNEPRDAIAGTAWAVLAHPQVRAALAEGGLTWDQAYAEYLRLVTPIGMSPRIVTQDADCAGVRLRQGETVFLMFSSACRDERHFTAPDRYDPWRDTAPAIPFGAGPHFCAGAAASKAMIAHVALPMLFQRFPGLRLAGDVPFGGWAFRGPLRVPVTWST